VQTVWAAKDLPLIPCDKLVQQGEFRRTTVSEHKAASICSPQKLELRVVFSVLFQRSGRQEHIHDAMLLCQG